MASPSRFETLDSSAIARGNPLDAHKVKVVTEMSRRLRRKEQHLFTAGWFAAETGNEYDGDENAHVLQPYWRLVVPAIPVIKDPSVTRARIRLAYRARSAGGAFQITTQARPYNSRLGAGSDDPRIISFTGDDSVDLTEFTEIAMDPGHSESVEVYARGLEAGVDYTGTVASGWEIWSDHVYKPGGAGWTSNQYATRTIEILDGSTVIHTAEIYLNDSERAQFSPNMYPRAAYHYPGSSIQLGSATQFQIIDEDRLAVLSVHAMGFRQP